MQVHREPDRQVKRMKRGYSNSIEWFEWMAIAYVAVLVVLFITDVMGITHIMAPTGC